MSAPTVKCVIWDLDDTLWSGTLAEGDALGPDPAALALVERLEHAGIVQSIASKNDPNDARRALEALRIADRFAHPQISWSAKSAAVRTIIGALNIGEDATVFLDDSEFERAEVSTALGAVRCFALSDFMALDAREGLIPETTTPEAARRPAAYREEARRTAAQREFAGTPAEFLASLDMVLTVRPAGTEDLERGAELTERTNQLNSTGIGYSVAQLDRFRRDPDRRVLIAELEDRFGSYGRIGLMMLRRDGAAWTIELLLTSCRVMGRKVGNALIATVGRLAAYDGLPLRALCRANGRNRQMRITYAFVGFASAGEHDGTTVYEHPEPAAIAAPPYIRVIAEDV